MAKFEYAKGRIIEFLQFISYEMKEFDTRYADKTWEEYEKDRELQKIMERTVENILTALIEISGSILTQEDIVVENYADALKKCANLFNLTAEEQQDIEKLANIRNRLAHRYLNLKWQVINMYKTNCNLIQKLLTCILKREESKEGEMEREGLK
ncbi:MAG: HepT-like ribonuclease domain-containing protein [bacterium]